MDNITLKQIELCKGKDRFIIRYEPGRESEVLDTLIEWVAAARLHFDWFDAAVLSHQLGQQMAKKFQQQYNASK